MEHGMREFLAFVVAILLVYGVGYPEDMGHRWHRFAAAAWPEPDQLKVVAPKP